MAHILIIDDDLDIGAVLAKHLSLAGYDTSVARDGWEAVLALEQRAPDLVLLDIMLPGLDGASFLKIMRGIHPRRKTPVLIVTALAHEDAASRMSGARHEGILQKNERFYEDLLERVRTLVGD